MSNARIGTDFIPYEVISALVGTNTDIVLERIGTYNENTFNPNSSYTHTFIWLNWDDSVKLMSGFPNIGSGIIIVNNDIFIKIINILKLGIPLKSIEENIEEFLK